MNPLEDIPIPNHRQATRRLCGPCRHPGHTRRTCPSYATTQLVCNSTISNDGGSLGRLVGWDSLCPCLTCTEYRKFNKPTPRIAYQIIVDKQIAELIEAENKKWPTLTVQNNSRMPIYVYKYTSSLRLLKSIEPEESFKINCMGPFDVDEIEDYVITDNDYGNTVLLHSINPNHIRNLITVTYGTYEFIKITNKETSNVSRWKEAALKSKYLLDQLDRLGVTHNPNYEPIMDMIQDIKFPEYTEQDKERSGISSVYTNILETTGINEN